MNSIRRLFCGSQLRRKELIMAQSRPSSNMPAFKEHLKGAKQVVILTGMEPNAAHLAIAKYEEEAAKLGKKVTVITQNIDELHRRAGTKNLLELHGSLFRVRCTQCKMEAKNYQSPICEALRGKGAPDANAADARIKKEDLPKCDNCQGLLRPAVVWFGEGLDYDVLAQAEEDVDNSDVCLVVGTSSVVYPAAMFAPRAAQHGAIVAEFNIEDTVATSDFKFHFSGPCGQTIPLALA